MQTSITRNRYSEPAVLALVSCRTIAVVMAMAGGIIIGTAVATSNWLLVCLVAGMVILSFFPIEVALGAYAFAIPFDSVLMLRGQGPAITWVLGVLAGATLLAKGLLSDRFVQPPAATLWWCALVGWCATTYFWALEPALTAAALRGCFSLLLLYVIGSSLRITETELTWIIRATIAGGVLTAAIVCLEFLSGGGGRRAVLTIGSFRGNPNELGSSLLLPLALVINRYIHSKGFEKLVTCIAVIILGLCILLTMSRGTGIAVVVMIVLFMLRYGISSRTIAVVVLLAFVVSILPNYFFQRWEMTVQTGGAGRLSIWRVGLEVVRHYGLEGVGLANYPVDYNRFIGSAPIFIYFSLEPHNIYLELLSETGLLGVVLFLLALRAHFKTLSSLRSQAPRSVMSLLIAMEAASVAVLTHSFVANLLWRKLFWFNWIMLVLVTRVSAETAARKVIPAPVGSPH